jgi:hypothetical protein
MKTKLSFLLVSSLLACFAILPVAHAVTPAPDGGYPGGNTAEGQSALLSLTTGGYNTGIGYLSLKSNATSSFNTAVGAGALVANSAAENTAVGTGALLSNGNGPQNTATGAFALLLNTTGGGNSAFGDRALGATTTGDNNTAVGLSALAANTGGSAHTAVGFQALANNTSSGGLAANTAVGTEALANNTTGGDNVGVGLLALVNNSTGNSNTALGTGAGAQITGDNNIDIGQTVAGVAGESNTTRIGNSNATTTFITGIFGAAGFGGNPVYADADGRLYTVASSKRFKQDIKPMDKASEILLALKPVTFRYKKQIDPTGTTQFGLVAEEVEKVNRDLVVRDKSGKTYSVRYDQVNAMLLNEFLKEHKTIEEQEATIAQLKSSAAKQDTTVSELKKDIGIVMARLKEQTAQFQKVSAHIKLRKPVPQTASVISVAAQELNPFRPR